MTTTREELIRLADHVQIIENREQAIEAEFGYLCAMLLGLKNPEGLRGCLDRDDRIKPPENVSRQELAERCANLLEFIGVPPEKHPLPLSGCYTLHDWFHELIKKMTR